MTTNRRTSIAVLVLVGLTCGEDGRTLGGVEIGHAVSTLTAGRPAVDAYLGKFTSDDLVYALAAGHYGAG